MKRMLRSVLSGGFVLAAMAVLALTLGCSSCSKDNGDEDEDRGIPLINSGSDAFDHFLFCYDKNDYNVRYRTRNISSGFGSDIQSGNSDVLEGWDHMAGVQVGYRQFIFGHNSWEEFLRGSEDYFIGEITASGAVGGITENGSWENNYETLFGFRVGERGFIFGQDSYGDHHWFVQEITGQGRLADNESDHGNWSNYYETATPLYVNGETYLFFQTRSSHNYWFISHVSKDGGLSDVDDGYWGDFYDKATSVQSGGTTYLVGARTRIDTKATQWYIQKINSNGTMGSETHRGEWTYRYGRLVGFTNDGHAYIFGHNDTDGGLWFIQEITPDGKLGTETSHGTMDSGWDFFFPFNFYSPGGFRYTIGWDLSNSNGAPSRSWSPLYPDPRTGETKFGGGAALADIDGDINHRYDAVMTGIQDMAGNDRFYYKVAWNLDATGKASSWSQALFTPDISGEQAGGGADIGDIDGNGVPDLLLMYVDNPEAYNSFRYIIGWNLGKQGKASSWSSAYQGPTIGYLNSGGGAALGDIDHSGRPDLVLMGIDNPTTENTNYWYTIGRNLNAAGNAASWTPVINAHADLGWSSAGGGAALADIDGNGKLDLVLMNLDSPKGENQFWCTVGWDIDINGTVSRWSSFTGPKPGWIQTGGGAAIADINKDGIMDLLLLAIDDPYGKD